MPAVLTHDFFGQDAFGPVLGAIDLYTPDEREAFLLGNQGPDPLFYLMLLPPLKPFEELGQSMHHSTPSATLLALRKAADTLPPADKAIGQAYLAGFVCHYLLDRKVHPFVYFWERGICQAGVPELDLTDSGVVHAEIERDLDEMVLFAKRNQTIEQYRPYEQVLRARDEVLRVIGDLYFVAFTGAMSQGEPSANRVFPLAVQCFRTAQRLFWSPTEKGSKALAALEGKMLHKRYSLVKAMSHRVRSEARSDFDNSEHKAWRNPFSGAVKHESFWDLYNSALLEVAPSVSAVLAGGFDEAAAHALTRGENFCGEVVE